MRTRWLAVVVGLLGLALPASARAAVPTIVTRPAITGGDGRLYPGSVLTETPGVWSGAPTSVAIQWLACPRSDPSGGCSPIPGATGQTYTIQPSDVGSAIRLQEVASNADGSSTPAPSSNSTTDVLPLPPPPVPAPVSVTRPTISGSATVGSTLTSTPGTWSGGEPIALSYQWLFCRPTCLAIADATSPTLALKSAYVGGRMIVMVRASNAGGSTMIYGSSATFVITYSVRDLLLQALTLSGKPRTIGQLLKHGGYSVRFDAPHPGTVRFTWTATTTKHGKRTSVLVARGTELVTGPKLIRIELTPGGEALLKRARRLQVTAKATMRVGKRVVASASAPLVLTR